MVFPIHGSSEPESPPRECLDDGLSRPIVADRAAHRIDAGVKRAVGYGAAVPDGVDQLVLTDHPVPVADQIDQDAEHLWLDRNDDVVPAQFQAFGVERIGVETVNHGI